MKTVDQIIEALIERIYQLRRKSDMMIATGNTSKYDFDSYVWREEELKLLLKWINEDTL